MRPITLFVASLDGGGAQRVFVNLANTLVGLTDKPIHLVTIRKGGVFEDELHSEVRLIHLGTARVSRSLTALVKYMSAHHPRVFLSTMSDCNIIAALAWRIAGRPGRLVLREANVLREVSFLMRMLMRWTYPYADCIVALAPAIRASLLNASISVDKKTVEIGNPSAVLPSKEPVPAPSFLPDPQPQFICAVGSLTHQKGFDILLDAFSMLSDQSLHLAILGEGPLRHSLEKQCHKLGIRERVHMPGFVRRPIDVLGFSKLFVLPSRWEGFPNALLEALASGVPVIAADCDGACCSILEGGRYGKLVPPEDPSALAHAIERSLGCHSDDSALRRARADEFNAEKIARRYLAEAFLLEP